MDEVTVAFPPRSAHVETRGVVFFARQLDKIRLHAVGKLPPDYNLGFNRDDTFDARFSRFWNVDFAALTARALQGGTDEEIFDEIFAGRLPLNGEQVRAWNAFLRKRGLRDECSAEIAELKAASGWADRDDIQTYMDFQDADEGRTPHYG